MLLALFMPLAPLLPQGVLAPLVLPVLPALRVLCVVLVSTQEGTSGGPSSVTPTLSPAPLPAFQLPSISAPRLRPQALSCGYTGLVVLHGLVTGHGLRPHLYAREHPTYYGMMAAAFLPSTQHPSTPSTPSSS